jgi:hypothetical protein
MNENAPPVHASFVGSGEDSGVNLRGRPTGFAGGRVAEGLVLLPRGRKLNDGRRSSLSVSRDQSMPQTGRRAATTYTGAVVSVTGLSISTAETEFGSVTVMEGLGRS